MNNNVIRLVICYEQSENKLTNLLDLDMFFITRNSHEWNRINSPTNLV